jgi:hypothetical protein
VKTGKVSYEIPQLPSERDGPCAIADRALQWRQELLRVDSRACTRTSPSGSEGQATPKDQLEGLQTLPTEQVPRDRRQIRRPSGMGGDAWSARGKERQCLSNKAEVDRLVQMTQDATDQYPDFPGTPTFIINGKMAELGRVTEAEVWPAWKAS